MGRAGARRSRALRIPDARGRAGGVELVEESTIGNARAFLEVQSELGSFDAYLWRFVGGRPLQNRRRTSKDVPARTAASDAMSKDMKKRGFRFVGSTILYAHMQAVGMVNDHLVECFRHRQVAALR